MAKMQPKQSQAGQTLEQELEQLVSVTRRAEDRAAILALFSEMAAMESRTIHYEVRPAYNSA
jgi:predicted HTH domain antitoxin